MFIFPRAPFFVAKAMDKTETSGESTPLHIHLTDIPPTNLAEDE